MDGETGEEEEFDLRLDWEDSFEIDDAVATGAEDAEFVRAPDFIGSPVDALTAADLEEVREHIAAAFDAVRDLSVLVESLGERMDGLADRLDVPVANPAEGLAERIDAVAIDLATLIEGRMSALEEALGNDLDDFGEELARVGSAGAVPVAAPADSGDRVPAVAAPDPAIQKAVSQLSSVVGQLLEGQGTLESGLTRLGDEVATYRRRVQVHSRPPVITDEQIHQIIAGVVDSIMDRAPRTGPSPTSTPAPATVEPVSPEPASETIEPMPPAPAPPPKVKGRGRRRAKEAAPEVAPEPAPETIEPMPPEATAATIEVAPPELISETVEPMPPPPMPEPKGRGRRRAKEAVAEVAPGSAPETIEPTPPEATAATIEVAPDEPTSETIEPMPPPPMPEPKGRGRRRAKEVAPAPEPEPTVDAEFQLPPPPEPAPAPEPEPTLVINDGEPPPSRRRGRRRKG